MFNGLMFLECANGMGLRYRVDAISVPKGFDRTLLRQEGFGPWTEFYDQEQDEGRFERVEYMRFSFEEELVPSHLYRSVEDELIEHIERLILNA